MTIEQPGDALDVLACQYEKRPKGAPSFFDLEASIRRVERGPGVLRVVFDPAAAGAVEQLVDAERRCCPDIRWELEHAPAPTVRIITTEPRLDIFEGFLPKRPG